MLDRRLDALFNPPDYLVVEWVRAEAFPLRLGGDFERNHGRLTAGYSTRRQPLPRRDQLPAQRPQGPSPPSTTPFRSAVCRRPSPTPPSTHLRPPPTIDCQKILCLTFSLRPAKARDIPIKAAVTEAAPRASAQKQMNPSPRPPYPPSAASSPTRSPCNRHPDTRPYPSR